MLQMKHAASLKPNRFAFLAAVLPMEWAPSIGVLVIFIAAATVLFVTSPTSLDFWWGDAPRHALNGAFILDFVSAMPWHDPYRWAVSYYGQYPALTIGFYPPVFYCFEALFYAVFGVSHPAAQACVAVFSAGLGLAVYLLARTVLPRWPACCAGLLAMGVPEMAFWSRQVMLDTPAMTFLVFGIWWFVQFLKNDSGRALAFTTLLILLSIYTKYDDAFAVPALVITLLSARGIKGFVDRRVWLAAGIGLLFLVPAAVVNVFYIPVNLASMAGSRPSDYPLWSLNSWMFYPELLPHQLGFLTFAVIFLGVVAWIINGARTTRTGPHWFSVLLVSWFLIGYLTFSAIAVREPRHDLAILLPLVIAGTWGLYMCFPRWWCGLVEVAFAIGVLIQSTIAYPPPTLEGYRQVANYVAATAPRNAVVIFSGYHDANFIFALRTHEERCDIQTVRADKLFLNVAIERERGVTQNPYTTAQIADLIKQTGATLLVAQAGFWDDLAVMRRFEQVLHMATFKLLAEFPLRGQVSTSDGRGIAGGPRLEVYRPNYPTDVAPYQDDIKMKILGTDFHAAPHRCTSVTQ
jgi:hypothetical protein